MEEQLVKKCRVCGDNALSFNFNGLCCESCKMFFRRNAANSKLLLCFYGGNCSINVHTRRSCQHCRLKKCFKIGMKKESIIRKERTTTFDSELPCHSNNVAIAIGNSTKEAPKSDDQSKGAQLVCCQYYSEQANRNVVFPNQSTSDNPLKSYEMYCLDMVKRATLVFHEKAPAAVNIVGFTDDVLQVFNSQKYYLPSIIAFTGKVAGFAQLSQQSQINLVKAAFPYLMLFRSTYFLNFEKNAFLVALDESFDQAAYIRLDTIYGDRIVDEQRTFAYRVKDETDNDDVIRDLKTVLEYIKYLYTSYCHLLQRYLKHKYQNVEYANNKHTQILQIIKDMDALIHCGLDNISNKIESSNVSDVLSEIYFLDNQLQLPNA